MLKLLTDFHSCTVNEDKLQNYLIFKISANVRVCDSDQNLKMTKTSLIFFLSSRKTCKWSLHLNLSILTDFQTVTVNEDKLQN